MVDGLSRVLKLHSDTIGECGMSPYQILIGRDRNEAGIPYQLPKKCENATHFMKRMSEIDKKSGNVLSRYFGYPTSFGEC